MTSVRTVLGDVDPATLGVTDAHDHLFLRSQLLPGQELADEAAALVVLRELGAAGGQTLVQWTPYGMGRRRSALPELSRTSGIQVVAATGLHRAEHYAELPEDLAELFVSELTTGRVRAGLIKVSSSFHGVDDHARRTMTAAATAHLATGAPIAVHLEAGTGGLATMELLTGLGVPPERVILGHVGRFPDPAGQLALARIGAFLGFDGPSRANHPTDWRLRDGLTALADAGHADQLLIGGDTTTAAARLAPGPAWLLTTLRPSLDGALAERMFVRNPAAAFAADWR